MSHRPNYQSKPAIVRPAKKATHFTVTDIGGAADLATWKLERKRIEAEYVKEAAVRMQAAKSRAVDLLLGSMAPKLTPLEKAELKYRRHVISPKAVQAPPQNTDAPAVIVVPWLSKVKQACRNWLSNIWRSAFPDA